MTVERERELGTFVSNQVFCCLTDMVADLIGVNKIEIYEHLEEEAVYDGDIITIQERDEMVEELEDSLLEAETVEGEEKIQEKIDELNNLDDWRYPEIFEYWGVNGWFAQKLKDNGEVIIEDYLVTIWGRQTTGQNISMDGVIGEIYDDLQAEYREDE